MFSVQPKQIKDTADDGEEPSTSADGNMVSYGKLISLRLVHKHAFLDLGLEPPLG